ncbi:MAG: flagellar hook assembly protein FlgD [Desulfovibrio sp.]|jgi:flagellar basal-body rod modification protein FlgD|nr:flagellar hook assembly protein FlgD [Desulfovibrio sp.]
MAIANNIIGQYEVNNSSLTGASSTDRVATDKDTFLKLLVAQLTHQDPLNPVEDKEFIAQLAQFTTVEELQNINSGVKDLNTAYAQQQSINAASLINKMVVAGGDNIALVDAANFTSQDDYPAIYFTLPGQSAEGTFNVYATNSDGSIGSMVYSATMPGYQAGRNAAYWDGRDFNGNAMPNGTYIVNITAKDADGNNLLVTTSSAGVVVGVEMAEDGNHVLYLADGRTVNYSQIDLVMGYAGGSTATDTGSTGTDTADTGSGDTGSTDTESTGTDTADTGSGDTGSTGSG